MPHTKTISKFSGKCSISFPVGGTGDAHALPHLLDCLKDSQLSAAAFDAIYAIFLWHPDPDITALMNQACRMIPIKDAAVPLLDRIIQLQPDYYEVFLRCACCCMVTLINDKSSSMTV